MVNTRESISKIKDCILYQNALKQYKRDFARYACLDGPSSLVPTTSSHQICERYFRRWVTARCRLDALVSEPNTFHKNCSAKQYSSRCKYSTAAVSNSEMHCSAGHVSFGQRTCTSIASRWEWAFAVRVMAILVSAQPLEIAPIRTFCRRSSNISRFYVPESSKRFI